MNEDSIFNKPQFHILPVLFYQEQNYSSFYSFPYLNTVNNRLSYLSYKQEVFKSERAYEHDLKYFI